MATDTPSLNLRRMDEGQATAEVLHNESVNFIDALMRKAVISVLSVPPGSPSEGDVYLVGSGASGVWTGEDDSIAFFFADWFFLSPIEGWTIWINNVNDRLVYDGAAWLGGVIVDDLTDNSGGTSGGDTIAVVTDIASAADAVATLAERLNDLLTELRDTHGLINAT